MTRPSPERVGALWGFGRGGLVKHKVDLGGEGGEAKGPPVQSIYAYKGDSGTTLTDTPPGRALEPWRRGGGHFF